VARHRHIKKTIGSAEIREDTAPWVEPYRTKFFARLGDTDQSATRVGSSNLEGAKFGSVISCRVG
jgi:hypothetical protein